MCFACVIPFSSHFLVVCLWTCFSPKWQNICINFNESSMLKLFLIYFIIQILNIPRWRCIFGVTKSTICVCVLAYLKRRVRKMDVDFFPRLPIDILFYH